MRRSTPSNSRSLSDEEQRMWEHVTRHDVPLTDDNRCASINTPAPLTLSRVIPRLPVLHRAVAALPLTQGTYANIDRNTAERLRKGHYPIDGTLDLHGMNRERAHHALTGFVQSHYMRGSRCLLAITGKGANAAGERGVLREMLPRWLDEPELRPLILAFDTAKPKDGGGGAYYILLRRKRGSDA